MMNMKETNYTFVQLEIHCLIKPELKHKNTVDILITAGSYFHGFPILVQFADMIFRGFFYM